MGLAIYIVSGVGAVTLFFFILGHLASWSLGQVISNKSTTQVVLPTGEIVTNDSYKSQGGMLDVNGWYHNQLYFQKTASSPREKIDGDITFPADRISVASPFSLKDATLVSGGSDHLALVVDHYVFKRSTSGWVDCDGLFGGIVDAFFRSFLNADDVRVGRSGSDGGVEGSEPYPYLLGLTPVYRFDHFDPANCVLVMKRISSENELPPFLVYSGPAFDASWALDLPRTRAMNSLAIPPDPNLVIDISLIIHPKDLDSPFIGRSKALALPGARELTFKSFPLSSTQWNNLECPSTDRTEAPITEQYRTLFCFWDTMPDHCSFYWRKENPDQTEFHFVTTDIWYSRFISGGDTTNLFFRVRKTR